MLITAMGIFGVLVLQFKSILQPIIIFSSIPFVRAGSIIGLYLMDLSFSMMAFVGLISLFGIVVNNAIILIDSTNVNLRLGLDKHSAILKASAVRFTPILLTTRNDRRFNSINAIWWQFMAAPWCSTYFWIMYFCYIKLFIGACFNRIIYK